jgi:hypothetical protein
MEPLAVDLALLRTVLGTEMKIAPGRGLMAHVMRAADSGGRGAISIAGQVLDAQLPSHVKAGQDVRLVVRSVSAERVVLSLSDQPAVPLAPTSVPLPGGGALRVTEREQQERPGPGGGAARQVLAIRYDTPALGAIDLRFELDRAALRVAVTLDAGEPLRRAQAEAVTLRQALEDNIDMTVGLRLAARREPFDVYA